MRDSPFCTDRLSCALTSRGTVVCWSRSGSEELPLTNVTQLVAGAKFHCALDAQGKVTCWEGNACDTDAKRATLEAIQHDLGPVKKILAAGHTLCLTPERGSTTCFLPEVPRMPHKTAPPGVRAITGAGCMLLASGVVRCNFGPPADGHPPVGLVVFPGVFSDVVEGGHNPGYYGVQHCAIDQAGGVACCKDLVECKKHVFERKTFPSKAVQLVGANTFVAALLDNGDVYAWTSTVRVVRVPFAVEPSGRVSGLAKATEIAGGSTILCARRSDGTVACVGGGYGSDAGTVVHVPAPREPLRRRPSSPR